MPPMLALGDTDKRYEDPVFMSLLDNTRSIAEANPDDYDTIFLAGGHGTMFVFVDQSVADLVARFADGGYQHGEDQDERLATWEPSIDRPPVHRPDLMMIEGPRELFAEVRG